MTTIRITHRAGVGEWPHGTVVQLDDRRASRLIHDGYAVAVEDDPSPRKQKGGVGWQRKEPSLP